MRCPKCGGYSFDSDDRCLNCGHIVTSNTKPPLGWGMPDFRKKSVPEKNIAKQPVKLSICPHCHQTSLFYNDRERTYECLNLKCKQIFPQEGRAAAGHRIPREVPKDEATGAPYSDEPITSYQDGLSNPLLLGVKMFLADIRSWRLRYREGEYVCADFAQEVYDAATERGIRCGYVVISFEKGNVGHAIVAFETDYGLKFFEPQSGDEEDVIVGRRYSTQLKGVPEDDVINEIKITWNDGKTTTID